MMDSGGQKSLEGGLSDFGLVELLQAIEIDGRTGELHMDAEHHKGVIYFERGALTWCREYHNNALNLGAVLQELNMVKSAVIEEFFEQRKSDPLGDLIGQQLVDARVLTSEQLARALRTQLLWTVREMGLWKEGRYYFVRDVASPLRTTGTFAPARPETPTLDAAQVAMEIVRYEYEWNDLTQWLPQRMLTTLEMVQTPPDAHPLIFAPAVWRIISFVNVYHTPRQIAINRHIPEMDVARILAPLVREGLLYVPDTSDQALMMPLAAPGGDTVDLFALISRMLQDWQRRREMLDQLIALAVYINWTMGELQGVMTRQKIRPATDSLAKMLAREHCDRVKGYPLLVANNHIDIDHLRAGLGRLADDERRKGGARDFAIQAFETLSTALIAAFDAINRRIDMSIDRQQNYRYQNQATWESMLKEFRDSIRWS